MAFAALMRAAELARCGISRLRSFLRRQVSPRSGPSPHGPRTLIRRRGSRSARQIARAYITETAYAEPAPGSGDGHSGARPLVRTTSGGDGCWWHAPFGSDSTGP